jgi:hypothetical protein
MDQPSKPIEEGDLLAYLDGKRLSHVRKALRRSPELRKQLREILKGQKHLQQLFCQPHDLPQHSSDEPARPRC